MLISQKLQIFPPKKSCQVQIIRTFLPKPVIRPKLEKYDPEYTEKPEYPKIEDLSLRARRLRKREAWHENLQQISTVEEKLISINMRKYYGYKTIMLSDENFPYNCLPLTQHYTRTVFKQVDNFSSAAATATYYKRNEKIVESFVKSVRSGVEDALAFAALSTKQEIENKYRSQRLSPSEKDKLLGQAIVHQINRTLINSLSADCPHLAETVIDLDPRHDAFWFVGGVKPPDSLVKRRKRQPHEKDFVNDSVDRAVQYLGTPYLALRHRDPLDPLVKENEYENGELAKTVPRYAFDARTIGYSCTHRHGTNVPGFWPGSPHEFGILTYQHRNHLIGRKRSFGEEDNQLALHAHGIQSSYAWLLAIACYQGFSTFNDLTYPLSTQTIITNGQQWSFYVYQLNTSLVHASKIDDNPRVNLCWGTGEQRLYEEIDTESGKVIGFNDEVLKNLINFYANVPSERKGVQLRPYLGEKEQKCADIQDDDRRVWIEQRFKHLVANRPRDRPIPELYLWERIYKVNHKTRPMDARRRFFELEVNPFARRLDDHTPEYIPKVLRPDGPKSKAKWRKTYYPKKLE